ncbi:MAG: FHA domain-containing protein [Myxococcales bacterium]|nr:FHA domain-containing protein [Myxococcales bacterium]
MGVPAYMLSILHRQQLLLKEGFVTRYPLDWLIWEPGPWRPARSVLESNLESTQLPGSEQPARPTGEDAICFQLKLPTDGDLLRVGRSTTNDIVINDLTASREQFSLRWHEGAWMLEAAHGVVTVDGQPVEEQLGPLRSGAAIALGDVRATLLNANDMTARAAAFKARPAR